MTELERTILNEISLDEPWKLIETFAGIVREHPKKVSRFFTLCAMFPTVKETYVIDYKYFLTISTASAAVITATPITSD